MEDRSNLLEYDTKLRLASLYAIKTSLIIFLIFVVIWSIISFFSYPYVSYFNSLYFFSFFIIFYFIFILIIIVQKKINFVKKGGEMKGPKNHTTGGNIL